MSGRITNYALHMVAHALRRDRATGQTVMALVGGMGRSINGSYAELVSVPSSNVVAVNTNLSWEDLAAIPESYATAWTSPWIYAPVRPS